MPLSALVTINQAPPSEGWSSINSYDGSGNLEYFGMARSKQSILFTFAGATVSKANPAVVTYVAHGLQAGNAVKIFGATAGWATINGTWLITVVTADTFSIPIDSGAFAGNFDGTVVTYAPRTNSACWAIQRNFFGAAGLLRAGWACDPAHSGGTPAPIFAWDSRTTYPYA